MRNTYGPALILTVQPSGENNRSITVFSPEEGIFYATLYGGPKSKMRALVSPMNSGILYLYRDTSKRSVKITDFDVRNYHLSFRENLFKTYAAAFASEILIKTKCAGSPEETWKIMNGLLDGMELSDERESRLGLIRFIWRYLDILGVKPDTSRCCHCGKSLHAGKFTDDALSFNYVFDQGENGFICPDCLGQDESSASFHNIRFSLGKEALTYLEAVTSLKPKEVRQIIIDEKTLMEMKEFCFLLIENATGCRLKSLESGIGIL